MNPTPSENPPKSKRTKWVKRVAIATLCLLLLAAIAAVGVWFYLRSAAFNRYVSEQIEAKLPEYGLRGEIGGFGITLDENRARLKDLKLHNQQTGQLIATLRGAEIVFRIPDLYALKLSREVVIEKIALDGLELHVELDERGRTNFDGLHVAPATQKAVTFNTQHLLTSVSNGTLHFRDRLRQIEASLSGLSAEARPAPGTPEAVSVQCKAATGRVRYQGREAAIGPLDLAARVSAAGAEVESLALASSLGDVKAKGKVEAWAPLRHVFDIESKIKLDEAARMLAADIAVKGAAAADLHIEGQPGGDRITGSVRSAEVEAAGARLRDARIEGLRVNIRSGAIEFAGDRVTLQATEVGARGTIRTGPVALSEIAGTWKKGQTELTASTLTAANIEAPDARIATARLRNVQARVSDSGRYEATADAEAGETLAGGVKLANVMAQTRADNDELQVSQIRGKVFGGDFEADFEMPLAVQGPSKLKASFNGIETKDAAALFEIENLPVGGRVSGTADVSFVGTNPRSLSGEIVTRFEGKAGDAPASPAGVDAMPLTGDVRIVARNGVFNFERAELATEASKLTTSGSLSQDGNSDLRVSLRSSRAEELVQLARSLEVARPFIEQYEPQLIGEFKLDGRITGRLEAATIEGDVSATTVGLRDAILGELVGRVFVSPAELRIEKAVVNAPNGGKLNFDLTTPLDRKAKTGTLLAVAERISLETILAAAGAPSAERFISGDVSGEAHLMGLPGTLEGTARVNLVEGRIADQPAETAEAEVRFDGRDAFLEQLRVKLPQSLLTATGSMNLDDYAFKLEGKADRIALDNLSAALDLRETKIEGAADATFDVSGKVLVAGNQADLDWESLKVELNARSRDVKVNGREAGELTLTAETSAGGRLEAKLVTGMLASKPAEGQQSLPQTIKANIELRKTGRPVVIESDLSNLDVAPLLSLVAPDLVSTIAGTVTGRLRIEGPTTDPGGAATTEFLRGGLTLNATDLLVADNPATIETPMTIALDASRLSVPALRISGPGVDLNFSGAIGLRDDSPMNFALKGQVSLDRLPSLSPDLFLYGAMTIDARADGSLGEPRLGGKMEIAGFGLSSNNQPIFITDGAGVITLAGDQLTLNKFTARANEGSIEASGVTKLERFRPTEWRYAIKADNAELIEQNIAATISGNLQLAGTPEGQTLSGTVSIPQAEYQPDIDFDLIATGGAGNLSFGGLGGGGTSSLQNLKLPPLNLNVRIEARDSLIIRNKQINTVGTGSLRLGGKLADPDVDGRITLDGGTLRFRGQRYEITTGALDFPQGGGTALLNLVAEGELGGYRVYVGLIGPIDALDTTLRSEPDLSRTEILSLITTGRTETSTVASQDPLITGVGAAASLLTTGLISRPAEQLLGLSRFQIDPVIRPNSNPAARLTLGQQLSRNLYISYSTNLATEQDQTALAEYTLSNRFSALATYTQGGSGTRQSVREGVFTIELRGRQRFALGFRPEPALTPGAPDEALDRILRPKLPPAGVKVSEIPDLKLNLKKQRELLPVVTQGFSRSLARLGERRLLEYLQENGYFFAEVRTRCEPVTCSGDNLTLFYDIEPNVIYDLKEIRIEGTDILKLAAIQEYLQSQPANRLGKNPMLKNLRLLGGYVRGLTSNDRLKNDEEFIRAYLGDIGYRAARVKSRLAVKADSDDLIVIFDVDPGAQSEIAEVAVRGNTILPAGDLLRAVPAQPGDAFSYTRTRAGAQQIKQLYAQRGFLEADADLELVELSDDRVKLIYNVNEGARAIVSEVEITGVTKTRPGWIRRYLDFKNGEVLTPAKIRQTQRDLLATNAFREVNVRAEALGGPSSGGLDTGSAHRVTLNLTEAKPLLFVYGLGYSTDDGGRVLAEIANTNLGGTLDSLSLRLRGSRREQFAQLAFTDLRPFGTRLPTTISVFYNRNSNLIPFVRRRLVDGKEENSPGSRSFGLNRFAAFIQTERKLNERTSLRFRYNLERSSLFNIESFPQTEVTRNERAVKLGMFSVGLSRDTRDNIINPTRGQLISADHSIAANMFGGNESFNKFFGSYQRYRTLDPSTTLLKDSTLAIAARIGLASVFRDADRNGDGRISDSERRLPISERFFSGGATTLRGFRFETAGPQGILEPRPENPGELPTLVPLGGDALAVFNFELRYPLSTRLRLVPFYDLGNVFRRLTDVRFSRMTNTVGMGLRINTPLGPVGVDYGFLIDPPAYTSASGAILRQPRGAFHIRFGQTF
jgi:outer membrane protein assembly complex protein YaeT